MSENMANRQAEHALAASETRYRRLFEAAKDGILILDADTGIILDVNPFLTELTGFSHDDFVGKRLWEIGLLKDVADSKETFAELQTAEYVRYEDLPLQARNGQQIEVEFVSNVYRADNQKIVQCNIRDITARRQMEQALQEAHQWQVTEQSVRLAIASMAAPEHLGDVVAECARQLPALGASEFDSLALQVLNDDCTDFVSLGPGKKSKQGHPLWTQGTGWRGSGECITRYPWVIAVFHSGVARYEPRAPEEGPMQPGMSLIDVPFSHGTLAMNHRTSRAFTERDVALLARLAGLVSDGFQRFLGLVQQRQAEDAAAVSAARQRLRTHVLQMQVEEEWEEVVKVFDRELRQLMDFHQSNINIIDLPGNRARSYSVASRAVHGELSVLDRRIFAKAMETGQSVYRPRRTDPLFNPGMPHEVHSVVDVPFVGGTLAVSRTTEDAFDDADIHRLEQFAQVASEACRRLSDLQVIEAQQRQVETRLRLDLALQRVNGQVLQLQGEEDWQEVVRVFDRELRQLVPFHHCCINVVDLQRGRVWTYALQGNREEPLSPWLEAVVVEARRTGKSVYRPRRTDPRFNPDMPPELNSVADAPFAQGTVAINSTEVDAFTASHLQILEQFAQLMSTAHRRIEDVRALLHQEEQLRQAQRMESVGRLAGGVAHDFNNHLTVIMGAAQLSLRQSGLPEPLRQAFQEILAAAQRSADLTRQLLAFARRQPINPRVLDLNDTVSGLLRMLRRLVSENLELAWLPGRALWPVKLDPGQIDQLLANLVVNARDAIAGAGRITIETGIAELDEVYCRAHAGASVGQYVMLVVSDNGSGMDEPTRARIFEPFFTTKGVGQGTGLGLATVYGIVKQNNGFISVYSEPGQGTTFRIYLPRVATEAGAPPMPGETTDLPGGSETVLIVEDQGALLQLTAKALKGMGYTVLTAGTPAQALQLSRAHAGPIDLLLTDVVLPEMNGRELATRLAARRPTIKCLYMSGYTANAIAHHGVLDEGVKFLEKPFTLEALATKLREALAGL